jgi:transketolase
MLGDGEIQEGQIWEAALSGPKYKLDNLVAILDANGGQIDGPISAVMPLEPLAAKWEAFGWRVLEIDGHDPAAIVRAFDTARRPDGTGRPVFILARTVKGKGVSFMEHPTKWHGVAPSPADAERALTELEGGV